MKRTVALFFMLIILVPLYAKWNISLDLRGFDALWLESMRFDGEFGYRYEDIRLSLALSYGKSKTMELDFVEGGLSVDVYPFENIGLYVGCSVFKLGYMLGLAASDESIVFSSEARIGWSITMGHFLIEPRLSFSDTLSGEDSSLSLIREGIEQYSKFHLSLLVGVEI